MVDELQKQNFDLKLKVEQLQSRIAKIGPTSSVESLANENMELKVANGTLQSEVRTYKQLMEESLNQLDELKTSAAIRQSTSSSAYLHL